ncbi:hypothetical protein BDQ17DRAFT_1299191 [Cyathus striatus]|nr:hypothetical protein BDQ17DRAFT_1299191 [Cyathus striatus]
MWTPRAMIKRWGIRTVLMWSFIISLIIGLLVFGICMAVIRPNRRQSCYYPIYPRTGLENMPRFNQSFECIYYPAANSSQKLVRVPIGVADPQDHTFTILGNSTGTITLAGAPDGVEEVVYDFTLSAFSRNRSEEFKFYYPAKDKNGTTLNSHFIFETPQRDSPFSGLSCSRYSVIIYIPQRLRSLSLLSHTDTHIQFSPGSLVELDFLNITMTSSNRRNLILPHTSIRSKRLIIDSADAWVVGSVSLVKEVDISASYQFGVTSKVDVYPSPPTNFSNPEPAILKTWSGYGNMSIAYIGSASYVHRPIKSKHVSTGAPYGGQMSFEYTGANFNGLLDIRASSLSARGVYPLYKPDRKYSEYTHSVGNVDGEDRFVVKSSGRVNMWFPGDYLKPVGMPLAYRT